MSCYTENGITIFIKKKTARPNALTQATATVTHYPNLPVPSAGGGRSKDVDEL